MRKSVISLIMIFLLLLSFSGVVTANNLREVKVNPVNPGVDNLINSTNANWEILIDNSGGNLLISGDKIYIEFPSGFDLTYSNFVSLIPVTASGVYASGSGVVIGGSQIVIPVTNNQTTLGSFKIRISGIRNPSTPSGTYMAKVITMTSTGITLDGPSFSQPFLIISQPQYPTPSVISRVEVIPNYINLNVGASQLFVGKAYDIYGNLITGISFYWSLIPGTGNGVIDQNGYFTLTSFGSVTIKCEVLGTGNYGLAYINSYYPYPYPYYPYTVNNVVITPNNINLTSGNSKTFSAQAYDSLGNPIPNLTYIWTVSPISSGTFTISSDTKNLNFTLGSYSGVVTIKCEVAGYGIYNYAYINATSPPLNVDKILISPSNVTLSYSNPTQTFKATGYDNSGLVLSGLTFTWSAYPSIAGNLIVSPSDTSLCTFTLNPAFSGTAIINCSSSYGSPPKSIFGSSYINTTYYPYPYYPYLNTVLITPNNTSMSIGESKMFSAQAYNNYGNPIYGVTYLWTIISGSGYITPSSNSQTIYFTLTSNQSVTLKCEVVSLGITGFAYINSYAPPTPAINQPQVFVSPPTAGYQASYFISFNLSPLVSLSTGDYIMITFPNGTSLPSFIYPSYVSINGVPLTSYPVIYLSSRSILLYLPVTVSAGGSVNISFSYFCSIKNPPSVGTYNLLVTTTKTSTPILSSGYTIN